MKYPGKLLGLCALLSFAGPAAAAELTVKVTAQGVAVPDAVVLLRQSGLPVEPPGNPVMDQKGSQFAPFVLTVPVGAAVRFPNSDNIRHHVYSFSPTRRFELPLYSGTSAEPVEFGKPGIVTLGCNIHDWMLGFIYVTDASRHGVSNAEGEVKFDDIRDDLAGIHVWHPRMGVETIAVSVDRARGQNVISVSLTLGPELQREPTSRPSSLDRRRGR